SLGIPKEQVVLRLFEQHFADNQPTAQSRALLAPDERMGTFLYAAAIQEECDAWQKLINKNSYDELTRQVSTSEVLSFRQLPTIITDTVKLATIVEEVLCAETQP
ncbi:MAG: hypothetical protein KDE58_32375, partial [Caldilineaceae bacterium]|nr:hypothetical protein [Caldilineaceae bacterium]